MFHNLFPTFIAPQFFLQCRFTCKRIIPVLFFVCPSLILTSAVAATPISFKEITLDQETELSVKIYSARGKYRVLWIPGFATPMNSVDKIATQLTELDAEVWHADLLEARFLPKTPSNIYKIPGQDIISLITAALRVDNKKLFIYAESRAVIPVLLALRKMQQSRSNPKRFGGLILNSPYFYIETPDPGVDARLMPVVNATNLPIYIFQPKNSPRFWQLKQTVPALEKSGSDVFMQVLKEIRGRFHFRPDSTETENKLTQQFGLHILKAIKHLETVNHKIRVADKQPVKAIKKGGTKKDRILQTYKGNPEPPPLSLKNLSGRVVDLKSLKHQVVLVNFWASWCPPCVEEMPSLQRLSENLPEDSFVILGVNIAETHEVVQKFLSERINIKFPVLLDNDGNTMRQWNVMAFPTSFVVDKRGKIRYALFGSIEWDTPEIEEKILKLVNE